MSGKGIRLLLAMAVACALPGRAVAQGALTVQGPVGSLTLTIETGRGYGVLAESELERLGWRLEIGSRDVQAVLPGGERVRLSLGSPFFRWGSDLLQLADVPYAEGNHIYVPAQLVTDFLPARQEAAYLFDEEAFVLQVMDEGTWSRLAGSAGVDAPGLAAAPSEPDAVESVEPDRPGEGPPTAVREPVQPVVIIDAGHGGRDPGARGVSGKVEKDLALGLARALARELRRGGDVEVRLTRDDDELVPIWERGRLATEWKGDRPGIFISLHANALPGQRSVRGFETYFLSEARTDHERRVAENENAPLQLEADAQGAAQNPDLDFILRELRNLDHQHWSASLAESVQAALEDVHTGPSRGVKQGPFAVITNALMPAVLVELGFITNRQDERLLASQDFQAAAARVLAQAIRGFFERYPPGRPAAGAGR